MAPGLESSLKSLAISSDVNAQIFALLEEDKFTEVLSIIASSKAGNVPKIYVAYAQYRLGKEEACLSTLGSDTDRASRHLRAQALYRLERVCLRDLSSLKTDTSVQNELADIEVNEAAIAAQCALSGRPEAQYKADSTDASHEYLFNQSIILAATGQTELAIDALNRAVQTLKALNLESEDHDAEIAPIYAQLAHLNCDASRNAEAHSKDTDSSATYLTGVNFLEETNPYALFKAYQADTRLKRSSRLFSYQDRFVAYDKIMAMHRIGLSIKTAVHDYRAKYAFLDLERCSALQTLMFFNSTKESLQALLTKDPENLDAAAALISKLVRQKKGVSKSIGIIKSVPESVRNQSPGLIGLWCALSDLTAKSQSSEIVKDALKQASGPARIELLAGAVQRSFSIRKSSSNQVSVDEERLRELLELDPTNPIGQSAKSVLLSDEDGTVLHLPDLSSVDVVALELGSKRSADSLETPYKAVKKIKVKAQQQLDTEAKLDPERWLPKRDRSNYKPSKKEKMKSKGGHQGGMVDESLSSQGPALTTKSSEVPRKKKAKKGKK